MTIEERVVSVRSFVDNSDGNLNDAVTFFTNFKALYDEVLLNYGPEDKIYHEAKALVQTALCWLTTEYSMIPESELFFGQARYHNAKANNE